MAAGLLDDSLFEGSDTKGGTLRHISISEILQWATVVTTEKKLFEEVLWAVPACVRDH